MTAEFHLQKRGLAVWQYVTWYETYEEAKRNFDKVAKGDTGYSWRVVELHVKDEMILDGERPAQPDSDEVASEKLTQPIKSGWGSQPTDDEGKPTANNAIKSEHGLTGSVWVGNPVTKIKKRVDPAEVSAMMDEGWVKAGPRTVL